MRIKSVKKSPAKKVVVRKAAKKCAAKKPAKPAAKTVKFTVHADKGKTVCLAGDFNKWSPSAKKMAFKAGVYTATLKLEAGKSYQYKFVIDGTWCADPENANAVANDQGTFNSVIEVK